MSFCIFLDKNGLPWCRYGRYKGMHIGDQNSILYVAEWGLLNYRKWFIQEDDAILLSSRWWKKLDCRGFKPDNREIAKKQITYCAEWLIDSIFLGRDHAVWKHPYPMSYGMLPGWRSAHSQAVAMQFLSRAAELMDRPEYTEAFPRLLSAFEMPIDSGGLRDSNEDNGWWYQKFAQNEKNQVSVLNGTMFSLLGLYDLAKRHSDGRAEYLFRKGLPALLDRLPEFDLGHWTTYDNKGKKASVHYHKVVVGQLELLANITRMDQLFQWHKRFEGYGKLSKGEDGPPGPSSNRNAT